MMCEISLYLLQKQIIRLREDLEDKLGEDINNLSSPEVVKINSEIDKLVVSYMKRTM